MIIRNYVGGVMAGISILVYGYLIMTGTMTGTVPPGIILVFAGFGFFCLTDLGYEWGWILYEELYTKLERKLERPLPGWECFDREIRIANATVLICGVLLLWTVVLCMTQWTAQAVIGTEMLFPKFCVAILNTMSFLIGMLLCAKFIDVSVSLVSKAYRESCLQAIQVIKNRKNYKSCRN